MKKLSVVIITWNSERYVETCLRSVWMSLENIEHEIILVDNGSTDGTRSVLEKYAQQIMCLISRRLKTWVLLKQGILGCRLLVENIFGCWISIPKSILKLLEKCFLLWILILTVVYVDVNC